MEVAIRLVPSREGTALHPLLEDLTEAQREAVLHIEGPLLILAGPGSGKTRVVTHRVAWLLQQGVPGREILALTFTNKAAEEMRNRVQRLAPDQPVWVSTFHRFCARLLRQYAQYAGLQENYTIYDVDDAGKALRLALAKLKLDTTQFTPDAIAKSISWAKSNLILPDEYTPKSGNLLGAVVKQSYPLYQAQLAEANAADFDDLLLHVAVMLRENAEVRQTLDERYRFILVDEYQDTNLAQYVIARALSIDHPNLAVTGDPDQSIYGWRGANLNNILEFEKDFPDVRVVRLERNYRSTKRILRVAADLIAHNIRRKEKGLYTENGVGPPVRLVTYATQKDEAEGIADQMAAEIRAGRRRPRDFAVFYRINALSRSLEFALRDRGIPYQLVHALEFFQRKEIKDVLAYVQLLNNPHDTVALLRVINVPARGIGKTTVDRLTDHAAQQGLSLLDAARAARQIDALNKRAVAQLGKFVATIDRLAATAWRAPGVSPGMPEPDDSIPGLTPGARQEALAGGPVEEVLGLVLSETGYQEQLQKSGTEEDQERLANIEELLTVAREFDERHGGQGTLEAFLEESCLVSDVDDWEVEADRATLMTLHASKGLEFPVVFLIAVEEGLLPHERSRQSEEQLEEERRLMFVGITRAQQELQLSMAQYRDFRGQRKMTIPSHFLMELPREEMELAAPGLGVHFEAEPAWIEPVLSEPELPAAEAVERTPSARPALAVHLTTAAELANGGVASPPVAPDTFHQGMLVRHPKYGLGRIVALSGSGPGRKATVDFASAAGRKRFLLSESPLRPVEQRGQHQ